MPNIKSAYKRLRQTVKRTLFNRMRKSRVKTAEMVLDEILAMKNEEAAVTAFLAKYFPVEAKKENMDRKAAVAVALSKCFSELDKAAKVGVIHINKANRKKARLTALVAKKA